MTKLVTVQSAGDHTRLRRYEGNPRGKLLCTHEGFYDPATVLPQNVLAYYDSGAQQDRRGYRTHYDAAAAQVARRPA